jgi:dTDP-4-amino-4,6-dideoxygalactose transaminase
VCGSWGAARIDARSWESIGMVVSSAGLSVPFFRPEVGEDEIREVVDVLRSGWLTSGPRTKTFEQRFAEAVSAAHAVAVNSCTAALHLAVDALGLEQGDAVLVPAMTFAATAEVVRYKGALPILVDCDPDTLHLDLDDAQAKIRALRDGDLLDGLPKGAPVVGIIPVHVGGLMMDMRAVHGFARDFGLWVIEDAAHSFPAAWRPRKDAPWQKCGENTSSVTCFSFYANKTITTGEGGMATTNDQELADKMRLMCLHGLSHDAWERYSGGRSWDYRIVAPGYKYNLTDVAAAIGIHQLARAESMRKKRETIAMRYLSSFRGQRFFELPPVDENRIHAWHLFPIRLNRSALSIDRNAFFDELRQNGVACSVHWRPLHEHPYYQETFGWNASHCPNASEAFTRLVSLPLFSGMRDDEIDHVVKTVLTVAERHSR